MPVQDPDKVFLEDVINAYVRERTPVVVAPDRIRVAAKPLLSFWSGKTVGEVNGRLCRAYSKWRNVGDGTVRYELGRLSSAIRHWHKEHGQLAAIPTVTLPPSPTSRESFLSRDEAARLLAAARGYSFKNGVVTYDRSRAYPGLARFIIIGIGTGTRHKATLQLGWKPNRMGGYIDFATGNLYRQAEGAKRTKKRQTPVRLGKRLLSHLKRWKRIDQEKWSDDVPIIHTPTGKPIDRMRHQWYDAVDRADLGHITPHILRHTRATWLMQEGVPHFEAAGALAMSVQTLERTYGHHHPDFQSSASKV